MGVVPGHPERLWVNPDCGLKTRGWPETLAALRNMVQAAAECREEMHLVPLPPSGGDAPQGEAGRCRRQRSAMRLVPLPQSEGDAPGAAACLLHGGE